MTYCSDVYLAASEVNDTVILDNHRTSLYYTNSVSVYCFSLAGIKLVLLDYSIRHFF